MARMDAEEKNGQLTNRNTKLSPLFLIILPPIILPIKPLIRDPSRILAGRRPPPIRDPSRILAGKKPPRIARFVYVRGPLKIGYEYYFE